MREDLRAGQVASDVCDAPSCACEWRQECRGHRVWLQDEVVLEEGIKVAGVEDIGEVGVEGVEGGLEGLVGGGKHGVAQARGVQVGCTQARASASVLYKGMMCRCAGLRTQLVRG